MTKLLAACFVACTVLSGCETLRHVPSDEFRIEQTALGSERFRIRQLATSQNPPPNLDSGLLQKASEACGGRTFQVESILENQALNGFGHFQSPPPSVYFSEITVQCKAD